MEIKEIYAIGPAISLLMEGYIEQDKLISLNIDPNLRPSNLTPDHYLELAMETE